MQFRKKPVVIEAEQWIPNRGTRGVCCQHPSARCPHSNIDGAIAPHVHTIHNNQVVMLEPGDWIVPEPDGIHFYPIKPDIFAKSYEPAETPVRDATPIATDRERTMTVDDVVKLFGNTIFWNYLLDWPGDANKEAEYPLQLIEREQASPDDQREVLLRFEAGECCIQVATMHPILPHQDAESGITDCDVEFVQKLPVIIPTLLRAIDKLAAFKAYVHKRLDDAGVPVDPESSHKDEGCRIGGRLDVVLAERDMKGA